MSLSKKIKILLAQASTKPWLPFLIIFGGLFLILWPILIGGQIIVGKWTLLDQYPRLAFISRALANHESVIWTENFLSGFPIFFGAWGEHLQPISLLLFKWFDYVAVSHWIIFFNFLLGGWLSYLFGRNFSLSKLGALLVALIYIFNQWNLFYGSLIFWSNVFPLVPLLFLSILKVSQGHNKYILGVVAALAIGWLSVLGDIMFYTSLAAFFFALYLDLAKYTRHNSYFRNFKVTGLFLVAFLIGAFLALPKILPVLDFLQNSIRSSGVTENPGWLASAESHGYAGLSTLIGIFFPYFYLPYSDFIPFFQGADKLTFLYFGFLPLMILIILLFNIKAACKAEPRLKYFVALGAFTFMVLIKYIPLFWLIHKLPVFRLFGGTGKYATLLFFSIALMCGYGFDHLREYKDRLNFGRFMRGAKVFFLTLLAALVLLQTTLLLYRDKLLEWGKGYFEENLYRQATTGRPLSHYYDLIEDTFNKTVSNFSLTNFHYLAAVAFIFLSFGVIYLFYRNKISWAAFRKIAVITVFLNFVILWQGYFNTVPRTILDAVPASVNFIVEKQKTEMPFRTFKLWGGLSRYVDMGLNQDDIIEKLKLEMAMLQPNYYLLYNVQFVAGHENINSSRHSRLMAFIGADRAPKNEVWASDTDISIEDKTIRIQSPLNRNLLSMLNVKYVLSSFDFNPPWQKAYETTVTDANIPVKIFENPTVLPRVYFAQNVKFISSDEDLAFNELINTPDFAKTTLIECSEKSCIDSNSGEQFTDKITIEEIKGGYLKVKTSNRNSRWLVYSESNLPYWEVTINDSPVEVYTANYLFQAVHLPPGENEVIFNYPGALKQTWYASQNQFRRLLK